MATLSRIRIYPFKSLDPQQVDEVAMLPNGALEHDRRFALTDERGDLITAKRMASIHRLRSRFDPATDSLALRVEGTAEEHIFDLNGDRSELTGWLSNYFDVPIKLIESTEGGFPDDVESPGPTVISRATLEEVASWFGQLPLDVVRERFRANLEIDGVEPFWEDRLVAAGLGVVRFRIGDAELLGTNPCARCVVPSRDPRTAEPIQQFAKTFAGKRQETLPVWAARERFDHFYRLSTNTRRTAARPCTLRVGDAVEILGTE